MAHSKEKFLRIDEGFIEDTYNNDESPIYNTAKGFFVPVKFIPFNSNSDFDDFYDFGSGGKEGDKFLKSSITNHTCLDSTNLAKANGKIVEIHISTEKNPENNFFVQIITNAYKGGGVEIQRIDFDAVPDAGNWTLNFDGQITASLSKNLSANDLKNKLKALSNITDLIVTGNFTSGFVVKWNEAPYVGIDLTQLIEDSNTLTSSAIPVNITITTIQNGIMPLEFKGGTQIGTNIEKPAGPLITDLDIIYKNLTGFNFNEGDRIQVYIKRGAEGSGTDLGKAIEPAVRLYVQYT